MKSKAWHREGLMWCLISVSFATPLNLLGVQLERWPSDMFHEVLKTFSLPKIQRGNVLCVSPPPPFTSGALLISLIWLYCFCPFFFFAGECWVTIPECWPWCPNLSALTTILRKRVISSHGSAVYGPCVSTAHSTRWNSHVQQQEVSAMPVTDGSPDKPESQPFFLFVSELEGKLRDLMQIP